MRYSQILGKAYQTGEDQVISGQQVPKGYWLVRAKWYKLVQTSQQRAYVLLKEEIQLNMSIRWCACPQTHRTLNL